MLGIDLYQRYNLVSDWHLVAADGVRECYVKLTDGGGPAAVRGDAYVAGARAAGIQVGGYHFMEPTPTPEAQAEVFAAELRRLNALDIAPALDLEAATIPTGSRADYAKRFLTHLQSTLNISKVALYASASWDAGLAPDTWGIPGLIDWVASYGSNTGGEQAISAYHGHVDVHQYTSAGHVPGITGAVDLDDVLSDITESGSASPTPPSPQPPVSGPIARGTILRVGSRGADVARLQAALDHQYPAYSHLATDGIYGAQTEATVKEFQSRDHLTVDGIAGPQTLGALHLM